MPERRLIQKWGWNGISIPLTAAEARERRVVTQQAQICQLRACGPTRSQFSGDFTKKGLIPSARHLTSADINVLPSRSVQKKKQNKLNG